MNRLAVGTVFIIACFAQVAHGLDRDAASYDFTYQGLDRLFLVPGLDSVRVCLTIDTTARYTWAAEHVDRWDSMTDEQYNWWLAKQKETRSQRSFYVMQLKDGVYSQECMASAGEIFPVDHHLYFEVNLNDMTHYSESLEDSDSGKLQMLEQYRVTFDPENAADMRGLNMIAFAPVTLSELLGKDNNLPLLIQGNLVNRSTHVVSGTEIIEWQNTENGKLLCRLKKEDGHLKHAVFYEQSVPVVRELVYGDYKTNETTGVSYPSRLTIRRYGNLLIETIGDQRPMTENIITIESVETDF